MKWYLAYALGTVFAAGVAAPSAGTAETLGFYFMSVHEQDIYNSQGVRLTSIETILQQDRANYHRFGRPGPSDSGDPFFGNAQLRSQIPALFAAHPANRDMVNQYTTQPGRPEFADYIVSICGSSGRITSILLDYADGDGHKSCP